MNEDIKFFVGLNVRKDTMAASGVGPTTPVGDPDSRLLLSKRDHAGFCIKLPGKAGHRRIIGLATSCAPSRRVFLLAEPPR